MASLERGNDTAARNQIMAAINQINGLVKAKKLDASVGADLISELNDALDLI